MQDIAQAVDAVVAASVRQQQGFLVFDMNKTGRIAAWGDVHPVRPNGGQCGKGGGFDKGAVDRMNVTDFFKYRRRGGFAIQLFQRGKVVDNIALHCGSLNGSH
ncbi:hypothetical protein D3C79_962000 [compost metagenome]